MLARNENILKTFESDLTSRNFSKGSIHTYTTKLTAFLRWCESENIDPIDKDEAALARNLIRYADYLKANGNRHGTRVNIFSVLSRFYSTQKWEKVIRGERAGENPAAMVMHEYIREYKSNKSGSARRSISVEEASNFVNNILGIRDKCLCTLLFKTGLRASEALSIELDEINWNDNSIQLKDFPKRTYGPIFFDGETRFLLEKWIKIRANRHATSKYVFLSRKADRAMTISELEYIFHKNAIVSGLHNPESKRDHHFSPHYCRHWFSTHLWNDGKGMPWKLVKTLRGDSGREAIEDYIHIDRKVLRESYLAHIPKLWID